MRYDGNLAYDLEFRDNTARIREKVEEQKLQAKTKAKAKLVKTHKTIALCGVVLALCAGFMISRNVAVYEGRNEVEGLQKQLNELKEYSSQKAFELDRSLDLEEIENMAKTKLGMVRPEKYQTVYVNIKQEDVTEVTANEVEGIKGIFSIFKGEE